MFNRHEKWASNAMTSPVERRRRPGLLNSECNGCVKRVYSPSGGPTLLSCCCTGAFFLVDGFFSFIQAKSGMSHGQPDAAALLPGAGQAAYGALDGPVIDGRNARAPPPPPPPPTTTRPCSVRNSAMHGWLLMKPVSVSGPPPSSIIIVVD